MNIRRELDIESAKALVSGPWGLELTREVTRHCAPIMWVENPMKVDQWISSGTICFVDTGLRKFAVSAFHVYSAYLEALNRSKHIICQIYDQSFCPQDSVIDYSEQYDLITFRISESLVSSLDGLSFLVGAQQKWPPPPPQKDKGLFFAGYPGVGRVLDYDTITWGAFQSLCVANSVSDELISIHLNPDSVLESRNQVPQGFNAAGISGGPVLTLYESEQGINSWALGGIIYEAQPSWDILLARPVRMINQDGTLSK